jgi:hypothetical protein
MSEHQPIYYLNICFNKWSGHSHLFQLTHFGLSCPSFRLRRLSIIQAVCLSGYAFVSTSVGFITLCFKLNYTAHMRGAGLMVPVTFRAILNNMQ